MARRESIGLIGLGLVGKALARRLLDAGYVVKGFDVDEAARTLARQLGVEVAADASGAADGCRVVLLSLTDSPAVDTVLWGGDGIAPLCSEGTTILDTTTAEPQATESHHAKLREHQVRFIDVPLIGSSHVIADGDAVALVGDAESAAADYIDIVQAFASKVFFLGRAGQGHQAKLVANLVLGLNRLVLAEGLALAEKTGMDSRQMLDILKSGGAYSRVMDTKGDRMLAREFKPQARLAQHAKDVRLIIELAAGAGARVPVSELHAALLKEAIEKGWGGLDNAAIIKTYQ